MGSREGQVVAAVTPFDFVKAVLGGIPQGMRKEMLEFRSWTSGVHLSFGHFIQGSNIRKPCLWITSEHSGIAGQLTMCL